MATLTGKLADVTSKTPENISSITVKAPSARVGSGTDVIVSSPAEVTFDETTGDITISGLTGGLSWLYIEGDGWSDSIPLSVAEGMITLVEAIANAAGSPGMADYIRLLSELETRINDIAQGAVDTTLIWDKGIIPLDTTSLDDLENGLYFSNVEATATTLGLPAHPGSLTVFTYGAYGMAWMTSWSDPTRSWVAVKGSNGWGAWQDDSGRTQRLDVAWTNLDDVPEGTYFADNVSLSNGLGLPVTHGLLRISRGYGEYGMATMTDWRDPTDEWVSEHGGSGWATWRKRDWGVTEQLRDEWSTLDEVPDGVFFVDSTGEQSRLGLPAAHGTLEVRTAKPYGLATFKGWDEAGRTWVSERQTIGWRDWKPERLKLVDATTNSRNVIEVDHHGTAYGLDIQNYPGADAAVVLHNYTGDGEAMIIDNCDNQPAVSIYNTINTGITPDNIAKGDFIQFSPWSDVQRKVWKAKLTNDLTLKNDTEHPLSLQRVDEALVGSRAQDDIVLQVKDKAGEVTASIHSDGRVSDRYTRQGVGSPEGNVSAPVGSTYTDTAATNGAIRWVKTSGTGVTGWRDDYGDTISALETKADKDYVDAYSTEYAKVFVDESGNLLTGWKLDGTVEIPGLQIPRSDTNPKETYRTSDGGVAYAHADTTHVTSWGSSTLEGLAGQLTEKFAGQGATFTNGAKSGEKIEQSAARQGSIPAVIEPVTIPASGQVPVTSPSLGSPPNMQAFAGHINGVPGTLSATGGQVYFTRTGSGDPVVVEQDTEFIPDSTGEKRGWATLFAAGKNNTDTATSVEHVTQQTQAMIDHLTPLFPRFLIVGHHVNTGTTSSWPSQAEWVNAINANLKNKYGPLFFDTMAHLTSPDIWQKAGIAPTQDDLAAQQAGELPPSLARDIGHFNDIGNRVIAEEIMSHIQQLGWY